MDGFEMLINDRSVMLYPHTTNMPAAIEDDGRKEGEKTRQPHCERSPFGRENPMYHRGRSAALTANF